MDIIWKGSPNFQKRTKPVKKIIIHWFGVGTLESANARFQNSNAAVPASAHYGISKGRVWQWVKETDIAYQAGVWAVNTETIGIEHDATTDHNLAEQDYLLSAQLVREIAQRHNIPLDRQHIIGHRDVKPTQCPGTIDINKIINLAKNMAQIKTQAKGASRRIVLEAANQTEWQSLCAVMGKDPDVPDESVKDA
jgi:N-acetyl-anhydromuramyl-L-alanine amidase AmpD